MSRINWDEVLVNSTRTSARVLENFANGQASGREVLREASGAVYTALRQSFRSRGVQDTRHLVRKALRRRNVSLVNL